MGTLSNLLPTYISQRGLVLFNWVLRVSFGHAFWAFVGFGLFYVICRYSIYGYAWVNGIRLPAEGVGFLGPLGGMLYIFCALVTLLVGYLIRAIWQAFEVLNIVRNGSYSWTKSDYWSLIAVILAYCLATAFTLIILKRPELLLVPISLVLMLQVPYGFARFGFARLDSLLPALVIQVILVLTVYVVLTFIFAVGIFNGTVLELVGYGGGRQVVVSTAKPDGKCSEEIRGKLVLRSVAFLTVSPSLDPKEFVELPVADVCKLTYLDPSPANSSKSGQSPIPQNWDRQ